MDRLYFLIVGAVAVYVVINYMLHRVGYYEDSNGEEQAQDDKT